MSDTRLEYTRTWTNADDFPYLGFTRSWESSEDYPTYEPDEAVVRADMQSLHDETKNYINNTLIPEMLAADATEKAREASETAREDAEAARANAETAREKAEADRVSETEGIVARATDKVTEAKSWAVGGTSTRAGEDTDNAKYWCSQAQKVAGGEFATEEYVNTVDIDCGTF